MMKRSSLAVLVLSGVVSGCQTYHQPYYGEGQGYHQSQASSQTSVMKGEPARQALAQPGTVYSAHTSEDSPYLTTEVSGLKERVRRIERALIRMDRRVQLIERNELSRMSGQHLSGENTPQAGGMFQPMSYAPDAVSKIQPAAAPAKAPMMRQTSAQPQQPKSGYAVRTLPFQRSQAPTNGFFQPVSMQQATPAKEQVITSSLQVAPKQVAYARQAEHKTGLAAMPSLADKSNTQPQNDDISIWTIKYEMDKVWPDRKELKLSHNVVQALRSDEPVALFARGARPASREFRERVRAVSKYLSKVSNLENVPIASMPAKHLDEDTIEILATK